MAVVDIPDWLGELLFGIRHVKQDGAPVNDTSTLNVTAPLTATYNTGTGEIDLSLTNGTPAALPSLVSVTLGGISGAADLFPVPLWVNDTGAAVAFAGARLWPSDNLTHDGTNYETISLLVYTGTSLTGSPTSPGHVNTSAVDWVTGVPLAFSGVAFAVPSGGTLALNVTKTGTGATLPVFAVRMR